MKVDANLNYVKFPKQITPRSIKEKVPWFPKSKFPIENCWRVGISLLVGSENQRWKQKLG